MKVSKKQLTRRDAASHIWPQYCGCTILWLATGACASCCLAAGPSGRSFAAMQDNALPAFWRHHDVPANVNYPLNVGLRRQ